MITISEDYWQGSGWTSKAGKEIEGYWEGGGVEKNTALRRFGKELQEMYENHPAAFNLLIQNINDFKSNIMQSTGLSSSINRLESSFTAGMRVGQEKMSIFFGKIAATNPALAEFRNWTNQITMEIEKMTQTNWIGSTIGGLLGAALTSYYLGNPTLGAAAGAFLGALIENLFNLTPPELPPGTTVHSSRSGVQYCGPWGTTRSIDEAWRLYYDWKAVNESRDRYRAPTLTPAQEVETFKKYIRRYNLI